MLRESTFNVSDELSVVSFPLGLPISPGREQDTPTKKQVKQITNRKENILIGAVEVNGTGNVASTKIAYKQLRIEVILSISSLANLCADKRINP